MKKIIRLAQNIIKYIIVFFCVLAILFATLVITAKIPKEIISENIKDSVSKCFDIRSKTEIAKEVRKIESTYRHVYADSMILNIICCINSEKPVESVMEAKYFSEQRNKEINYNLEKLLEKDEVGNTQYIRYWHGSMAIIRPLLVLFDLEQIYIINAIILSICAIILLILLIKTKIKELVISYIISMIMTMIFVVPFCLEYYWTFLIMFITSIVAIILEKKNKKLDILFLITGMITCFLDFLSTETITILVPMIFILVIKYKKGELTFAKALKFILSSGILWTIGYIGMWAAKWILASIILKINAMDYVINDMMLRIDGTGNPEIPIYKVKNLNNKSIEKNFKTLFPINYISKRNDLIICIFAVILIFELIIIEKKEIKKLWFSLILLAIAMIPYVRFYVLASHSYTHGFFTFRAQITSIMAIILAITYSISNKILNAE